MNPKDPSGAPVEIDKSPPEGIKAVTVYNRTVLVDKAIATLKERLVEGAVLVVAVLLSFLGNFGPALITTMMIPLLMPFTFSAWWLGASAPI